jgi:hypothetical protein
MESLCNAKKWHIACLPKKSARKCQALHAYIHVPCNTKIQRGSCGTHALTYAGLKKDYKSPRNIVAEFFFCTEDIGRCLKESKTLFVVDWPPLPITWPVKVDTNLTVKEVIVLEEARFQLQQRGVLSPCQQFQVSLDMPLFQSHFFVPADFTLFDTFRHGFAIQRIKDVPTSEQRNKWSSAALMNNCYVSNFFAIPYPGWYCVITLVTGKEKSYCITFTNLPSSLCLDFQMIQFEALGKKGKWMYCKHVYYILRYLCKLDFQVDKFMHAPSYSFNEVMCILELANIAEVP